MSGEHIVSSFDEDMGKLRGLFMEMGRIVATQLKAATQALRQEDRDLAKQVMAGDKQLNHLELELNDLAIDILALRQPFAGDANEVRAQDVAVDKLHNALFREMLTYMMEDPRNISGCMHVMFMAKNIERMGDHVADIAKELIYMKTGDWPEEKRVKRDKTSRIIVEPET